MNVCDSYIVSPCWLCWLGFAEVEVEQRGPQGPNNIRRAVRRGRSSMPMLQTWGGGVDRKSSGVNPRKQHHFVAPVSQVTLVSLRALFCPPWNLVSITAARDSQMGTGRVNQTLSAHRLPEPPGAATEIRCRRRPLKPGC